MWSWRRAGAAAKEQRAAVLRDVERLRTQVAETDAYALDETLAFFAAAGSALGLLRWLFGRRRLLDPGRIRELADFDLPHWQGVLQSDLALVSSRRRFPGLVEPLVAELLEIVAERARQPGLVRVGSVGCGAMEVERQLMQRSEHSERLRVVGWDSSTAAFRSASDNAARSGIQVRRLTSGQLADDEPGVFFYEGDAVETLGGSPPHTFDVIFHSRFRHHLPMEEREAFDRSCQRIATVVVEYDDYQCLPSLIGPLLTAWRRRVLLNGALISWVRGRDRAAIEAAYGETVSFHNPPGTYLRLTGGRVRRT